MMNTLINVPAVPAESNSARAVRITAAAGIAALALSAAWTAPAWAHDSLISSTPEASEVLETSPEEVVLEFSGAGLTTGEGITNDIWVLDDDGENWATEDPAVVEGSVMSTELREELPNGEYEIRYRAVYADGHDEELTFTFEVDAPEEGSVPESPADASGAAASPDVDEVTGSQAGPAESGEPSPAETAEDNPAAEEGGFPVWTAAAIGGGVLLVVIIALVLVRRKLATGDRENS